MPHDSRGACGARRWCRGVSISRRPTSRLLVRSHRAGSKGLRIRHPRMIMCDMSAEAAWFAAEEAVDERTRQFVATVAAAATSWTFADLVPGDTSSTLGPPAVGAREVAVHLRVPGLTTKRCYLQVVYDPDVGDSPRSRLDGALARSTSTATTTTAAHLRTRTPISGSLGSRRRRSSAARGQRHGWSASCTARSYAASGTRRPRAGRR